MRISDWSSDVCSSDLLQARVDMNKRAERIDQERRDPRCSSRHCHRPNKRSAGRRTPCRQRPEHYSPELSEQRSEEHTSELQSLMRISYAVFCLKKKNKKTTIKSLNHTHLTHKQ